MMPSALIFDMDGTLVDNNACHFGAWKSMLAAHGKTLSEEEYLSRVSGVNSAVTLRRLFGEGLPEAELRSLQREKEALYRRYATTRLRPLPGLLPFLRAVRAKGIPTGLATSAPEENIGFTLGEIGVTGLFDVITDAAMVGRGKPDPEIFLVTAQKLGAPPASSVAFEDSVSGLAAARAAGMRVVALTTAHARETLTDTDLVIDDYRGLDPGRLSILFSTVT